MTETSRVLRVEPDEAERAAKVLGGLARELGSGLAGLDERIVGLLGSSWSGDASAAYGRVWQAWHHGGGDVIAGLATMSELLLGAAADFRDV